MPIERLLKREQQTLPTREAASRFAEPLRVPLPTAPPGPYVEVASVATGLATLYERLRNTLDFRDEHLIRIYAIRRMLKRRLVRGARADTVALPLLQELIRGGYIEKDTVPETRVADTERLLVKYIQLFSFLAGQRGKTESGVWEWVFLLAASELEELLVPAPHRLEVLRRLCEAVREERLLQQWNLPDRLERQLITIAVYRMLLKLNNELLLWPLFKLHMPQWTQHPSVDTIRALAADLSALRQEVERALHHRAADRLARALKPVTTSLWLLLQGLDGQADRASTLDHPDTLAAMMTETVQQHYKAARQRLSRTLQRSLLYIFITKMALALLVEVPADRVLAGSVDVRNLLLNIAVPLLLLLVFGLAVRVPGERNTQEIIAITERLISSGRLALDPVRRPAGSRVVLDRAFNVFYGVVYLITFGAIVTLLLRIHFTLAGIALFLFFLSIVSFFGFRIREQAQELIVTKGQERFLVFLFVLFYLPILRTGRWIAQQSSRINLFLYFFDLFIEAPLQTFIEYFDKFTGYVREKREDITS